MYNKKNNHALNSFIIVIGIILIILLIGVFYIIYGSMRKNETEEYKVLTPLKGDGKNMNLCPTGCIRGSCSNKSSDNCKYDFQCQYCQDATTNMFYVEFNKEREILPLYEEQKNMNLSQITLLNQSINSNNKYIDQINNKLKIINS